MSLIPVYRGTTPGDDPKTALSLMNCVTRSGDPIPLGGEQPLDRYFLHIGGKEEANGHASVAWCRKANCYNAFIHKSDKTSEVGTTSGIVGAIGSIIWLRREPPLLDACLVHESWESRSQESE
jgi:hypothetical protein